MIRADAGHFTHEKDPWLGHLHTVVLSPPRVDSAYILANGGTPECCVWIWHRDGSGVALLVVLMLVLGSLWAYHHDF